jgi:hypothetical protein
MNRRSHPTARTLTGSIALAVVALSLAGCSTGDKAGPKAPGSTASSTAGAPSGQLKDQSAALLAWTPPAPVAKTEGKLVDQPLKKAATVPAIAEIVSVQAGEASTVLIWQLSSATDIPLQGFSLNTYEGARFWPDAVRLVDPVGKKTYAVNTMNVGDATHCVCSTFPIHVGPDPVRMTSEYPPLPLTVTSVSVRIPNFAPVDVPVSR